METTLKFPQEDSGLGNRTICWHKGQTQGSTPRAHKQALTTGPFGNTCKVDAVSPEAVMRGLQDRDVYNQREYQVDLTQKKHNIHISLIKFDLFHTSIRSTIAM
jgi:hypothetical protein